MELDDPIVVVGGIIFLLLVALCAFSVNKYNVEKKGLQEIHYQGYNDKDVEVFLDSYKYKAEQFLNSPGLREQYASWTKGINMLSERKSVIAEEQARNANNTAAFAVGMSAASMGSSR